MKHENPNISLEKSPCAGDRESLYYKAEKERNH